MRVGFLVGFWWVFFCDPYPQQIFEMGFLLGFLVGFWWVFSGFLVGFLVVFTELILDLLFSSSMFQKNREFLKKK